MFEPDNGFRWTDGDAALPEAVLVTITAPCELELQLGGTIRYPAPGFPAGMRQPG